MQLYSVSVQRCTVETAFCFTADLCALKAHNAYVSLRLRSEVQRQHYTVSIELPHLSHNKKSSTSFQAIQKFIVQMTKGRFVV